MQRLELWGGLECTVARIGDEYRDQILETGHFDRVEDLDRIAALGIRTLRYPVLWETISPDSPGTRRISPGTTSASPACAPSGSRRSPACATTAAGRATPTCSTRAWPDLLARHAARVAERYPDIDRLHARQRASDHRPVLRASTATGIRMARAMRAFLPRAGQRVQGDRSRHAGHPQGEARTRSSFRPTTSARPSRPRPSPIRPSTRTSGAGSPSTCCAGWIDRHHPWWAMFRSHGVAEADLALFLDADAAPDIIGINHYLTSERYLDERLGRYPRAPPRRQRPAPLCGRRGRPHAACRAGSRARRAAARDLGALPPAGRGDRSPSWLHP